MIDLPFDGPTVAVILAVYLLAGTVKGTVGLGLPAVSISLLAPTIGFHTAVALMLIPALLSNVWQAFFGGHLHLIAERLWPFLLSGLIAIAVTALFALAASGDVLTKILGAILIVHSGLGLLGYHTPAPSPRWERPMSAAMGGINGVIGGLTGIYSVPSAAYLPTLKLGRDVFVQAVGVWFSTCSAVLLIAYGTSATYTGGILTLSILCLLPSFAGMALGQRLRKRLDENRFRQAVLIALFLLGIYLIARALLMAG